MARFHNVYGPHGTWDGGREKAPAAICRKVIHAKETGKHEIEIWGDGKQTRSFMYIDDCINGIDTIMHSDIVEPLNLGSDELTTINGLVDIVEDIAGIKLEAELQSVGPQGSQRPQQRQHADQEVSRLGAAVSGCATAWRRRTLGFTKNTRRSTAARPRGPKACPCPYA